MSLLSSRRLPWPHRMLISGHGVQLLAGQDGQLVGTKTRTLDNVTPTEQSYSSQPVYKERTFPFRPRRGMGERVQSSGTDQRYRRGKNVWVVSGLFGKGPLFHTISPASTGSVRQFTEALHGGVLTQFVLAGQYVLRRSDDTNSGQVISDNRSTHLATGAVRFKGAYASPVDGLYVAWDDGVLREYDGASWNACTVPAGFLPSFLETVGDELWAADATNSTVRKATADPKSSGSWSAAILVGNPSTKITAIRKIDTSLFIFKDDGGVFTLNADGSDNDLFPGLRVSADQTNARTAAAWLDSLWFRMGDSFYRLLGNDATISPVGPERLRDDDSEVRGPVQAFAGWGTIVAFLITYNSATSTSYLLQYGDWQLPANGDAQFLFADQFDGSVLEWSGKQASAMLVTGIASPDTRLYVGFTDGTWGYIKLVSNPLAPNSGAEFTTGTSSIWIPLHHAMFEADWKSLHGFSAFGPVLNATNYAQIQYALDGGGYVALGSNLTGSAVRVDTPNDTASLLLDVQIDLVNGSTSTTPVLEGIAIHEKVRPRFQIDYAGTIDARDYVGLLDGSADRKSAQEIRDLVQAAASAPGSVTITLPDETVQDLSFFDYTERLLSPGGRRGWAISFQATQFKTRTVYGTWDRVKIYTWDQVISYSWDQLLTL